MPILLVWSEQVHILKHGSRIFRAESDQIHDVGVYFVARHGAWIIRVSHQNKAGFQPLGKPPRIKSGNIGSVARV